MVKAWEAKNDQRVKRAAGLGLMAVSLAACGGEDDTPYGQTDIDALEAAIASAVAGKTAAEAQATAAATAQAAAEATATAAVSAQAAAEAAKVAAQAAQADAEAAKAAAETAQAVAEADAAAAQTAQATAEAAAAAAQTAQAAAETARDAALAAQAVAEADLSSLIAELTAAGFTDLTDLINAYAALVAPQAIVLVAGTEAVSGGVGNDIITGLQATAGDTFDAGDVINGGAGTDTLTITSSEATINAATVSAVEIININASVVGGSALSWDAANVTAGDTINITRSAVGVISGTGAATISNLASGAVLTVNTVSGVSSLVVEQQTGDGVAVNATGVTGNVTLHGAGTIVANDSAVTATVTVSDIDIGAAALAAAGLDGAVSVTTSAGTVSVGMGAGALTGNVSINASAAATVNVDTTGSSTIVAAAATLINVDNVDASGTNITAGATGTTATPVVIALDGTTATTDVATISAAGVVTIDDQGDEIETLNLSGNGAAATYTIDAGFGWTSVVATGASAVNITGAADDFDGASVVGVTTITLNAAATGAVDMTEVAATTINLGTVNHLAQNLTVAAGANLIVAADQTGFDVFAATDGSSVTVTTADDVAGSAVGTITLGAADLNDTNDFASIALVANDAHLTATSFDADDATVTIQGSCNVNLGTVTASSVDASSSTGTLALTMSATLASVSGSTGANTIAMNDGGAGSVMTLNTYDGADGITVTAVGDGTIVNTGAGDDSVALADAGANAFDLGAGNDTVTVAANADIDAVIVFGDGTSDEIVFQSTATIDLADNTNFAIYGVESVDVTATVGGITISAAQFALDAEFELVGNGAGDTLIIEAAASGSTITTSGVTLSGTATLQISGGAGADVINGGDLGETIIGGDGIDSISAGDGADTILIAAAADLEAGDVIDGGDGTDTIDYTVVAAFDLSVATISNVEVLDTNGQSGTLQQGTGIVSVAGYAHGAADTLVLKALSTAFEAGAELTSGAVDVAGEWFMQAEGAATDAALTYYDELLGEAQTITFLLTANVAGNDFATVLGGNLVVSIA